MTVHFAEAVFIGFITALQTPEVEHIYEKESQKEPVFTDPICDLSAGIF